ncbi:MAG: class I SAM-dependent methyltransferase [Bacteroidales bacterium]
MAPVNIALRYLSYKLFAGHKSGHGIHSPFVYNFVREALCAKALNAGMLKIEQKREALLKSKKEILTDNHGAGTKTKEGGARTLRSVVKSSSVVKKYGTMLYRTVKYFNPDTIVELGTSAGISTMYLAMADPSKKVFTIEANEALADIAAENFRQSGLQNIEVIKGNFDDVLPELLKRCTGRMLFYIDGNHRGDATMDYFGLCCGHAEESLMVFDDINWSEDMYNAWKLIRADNRVKISISLFRMGIAITGPKYLKQDYVIKY